MSMKPPLYGLMAEFTDEEALLHAARYTHQAGYRHLRAYTPFPVDELAEIFSPRRNWLPWLVLLGGLVGGVVGYGMQYYSAVIAFPFDVGGRPLHSWPAFIPVTFEMILLFAAVAALVGMLLLNGLPQPYHPVFNVPEFELASQTRFFLCIRSTDPKFHRERTRRLLQDMGARLVREVEY